MNNDQTQKYWITPRPYFLFIIITLYPTTLDKILPILKCYPGLAHCVILFDNCLGDAER